MKKSFLRKKKKKGEGPSKKDVGLKISLSLLCTWCVWVRRRFLSSRNQKEGESKKGSSSSERT